MDITVSSVLPIVDNYSTSISIMIALEEDTMIVKVKVLNASPVEVY